MDFLRKENLISKKPTAHKFKNEKERKMAKTKNRIKKMIFQTQNRRHLPLSEVSEEHKYILARREPVIGFKKDEILSRTTGGTIRPQHI